MGFQRSFNAADRHPSLACNPPDRHPGITRSDPRRNLVLLRPASGERAERCRPAANGGLADAISAGDFSARLTRFPAFDP